MSKYLLNNETQKIEMHFDKDDYMALSNEQKKEIKSAFLFSGKAKAWVSRSTNNHYRAKQIAEKLGLEDAGKIGERLSYAEELERKTEKAEARAERYDQYSENAERRAENLQADFNEYRKDWSWLTQPIIAGHSGSRAFANHKNKVIARYEKGFEEYQKSDYYKDRATTARATADNVKLQDKVYLIKKIEEQNKAIKNIQEAIVKNENTLYRVQNGETLHFRYTKELATVEKMEELITENLEKYDYEYDKLDFFEKCLAELGGVQFSKENIKVGYIVNIQGSDRCRILSSGSKNVKYKILEGGAVGMVLIAPYAAITKIIEEKEVEKQVENTFKVGDIVTWESVSGNRIIEAYQIVKTTAKTVTIQKIKVENNKPIKDNFISEKQERRSIKEDRQGNPVLNNNDWWMYKYKVA